MAAHHANARFFVNKFSPADLQKEPAFDVELWRKRIKVTMEQIEQHQEVTPQTCDGECREQYQQQEVIVAEAFIHESKASCEITLLMTTS